MPITYSLKRKRAPPTPSPPSSPPTTNPSNTITAENTNPLPTIKTANPSTALHPPRIPLSDLSSTNTTTRPTKFQRTTASENGQGAKKKLKQLILDLGTSSAQKTCKNCGMNYTPSDATDRALHERFHDVWVNGMRVSRGVVEGAPNVRVVQGMKRKGETGGRGGLGGLGGLSGTGWLNAGWGKGGDERGDAGADTILSVDNHSSKAAKNAVERVLERVEGELGAVRLEREELWGYVGGSGVQDGSSAATKSSNSSGMKSSKSTTSTASSTASSSAVKAKKKGAKAKATTALPTPPTSSSPLPSSSPAPDQAPNTPTPTSTSSPAEVEKTKPRFTAHLYTHANRIVGLCLSERIRRAHWTLPLQSPLPTGSRQDDTHHQSDPLHLPTPEAVDIGVARIWVLPGMRRRGVAGRLLDAVIDFTAEGGDDESAATGKEYKETGKGDERIGRGAEGGRVGGGKEGRKRQDVRVAFSQLTAMGEGLARGCMEKKRGGGRVLIYDARGCCG